MHCMSYFFELCLSFAKQLLKQFADAVPNDRGLFVFADGSKSSIDMAFKQAALLINANMIFEDV